MEFILGELDLISGKFNNMSNTLKQYSTTRYEIITMGEVSYLDTNEPLNGTALIDLYDELGSKISSKLNGVYSLCLFNKQNKTFRILQDLMGGSTYLYYTICENTFIFSSSLKKLLERYIGERKYNAPKEWFFLYNGFLLGQDTLLQGIFKLAPHTCLTLIAGNIRLETCKPQLEELSEEDGVEQFQHRLNRAIRKQVEHEFADEEISIALSAGYDSNYILYYVTSRYGNRIRAFSVGGSRGVNEINAVKSILEHYDHIQLTQVVVSDDVLNVMPDIVERLEGAVYERGIFLQYALADSINRSGKNRLLCGECADQVFNQNFYQKSSTATYLYGYADNPYEMGSYLVLKKNGIMFNSFGIRGLYPFLDRHVVGAGKALRKLNGCDKQFHKLTCQEVLPENVMVHVGKQGGSTSLEALFANSQKQSEFIEQRKQGNIFLPDFRISQKYSENESKLEYFMCIYYLEWFKKIFIGS